MHLTNYSVNKKNVDYKANTDETACQGHKWYVEPGTYLCHVSFGGEQMKVEFRSLSVQPSPVSASKAGHTLVEFRLKMIC